MTGTQRRSTSSRAPAGAPVVALLLDRVARARATEALGPRCGIVFVQRAADLTARLGAGPASLVVVEPRDIDRASTLAAVETIRRDYPSVPVIAYAAPGHTPSSEILAMAQAGVHELIIQGFDDFGIALRTVAESALRNCAATRILSALAGDLTRDVVPFVRYCLERSWERPSVGAGARHLGVHRKTLVYRVERDLGLPPMILIGWCRLMLAAWLLEDPGRSVAQVALALDFGSSAALRGMLRRYVGVRPQELRAGGGLPVVLAAFRNQPRAGPARRAPVERVFPDLAPTLLESTAAPV